MTALPASTVELLLPVVMAVLAVALAAVWWHRRERRRRRRCPLSVNYHFSRECQYNCHFCYHTETSSYRAPLEDAKQVLHKLKRRGMEKLNFSGGEPLLHPEWLGEMARFARETLRLESVSIVTNGEQLTREWMQKYARHLDIVAISCDSFDDRTCRKLGRTRRDGKRGERTQAQIAQDVAKMCREHKVIFKINTVVTTLNCTEDMREHVNELRPERWKVFQMLLVEGENKGEGAKRKRAGRLKITGEQFRQFCDLQLRGDADGGVAGVSRDVLVPESNDDMRSSYFILDERLRFLDCSTGGKVPTATLVGASDVELEGILDDAHFDPDAFERRRGKYQWTRAREAGAGLGAAAAAAIGDGGGGGGGGCGGDIEDLCG